MSEEVKTTNEATTTGSVRVDAGVGRPTATWSASLDCECPNCNEDVDLMEADDFWSGRGDLEIAQPAEGLDVICPKCGHEFEVDCVW